MTRVLAALGVGQVSGAVGIDIAAIDWREALSLGASAAVLSLLTSIASGRIGPAASPSLVPVGAGVPKGAAVQVPAQKGSGEPLSAAQLAEIAAAAAAQAVAGVVARRVSGGDQPDAAPASQSEPGDKPAE